MFIINNLSVHLIFLFYLFALVIFKSKSLTSPYPQYDSSTLQNAMMSIHERWCKSGASDVKGKRWDKRQGGKLKLMLHFIEINALTSADASQGGSTLPLKIERILGYYHNITLRTSQTIFLMNMT